MASLRKRENSPYWYACFTGFDKKQRQLSTKETDEGEAQKIADKFETLAREKKLAVRFRRLAAELYQQAFATSMPEESIRSYFEHWVKQKEGEVALSTFKAYQSTANGFISFLGDTAAEPLEFLTSGHIRDFRNSVSKRTSPRTANNQLKHLRTCLKEARKDGAITENPADNVPLLSTRDQEPVRRPFTIDEIKKLLEVADNEWTGLILFGYNTGQRLGDLARLTFSKITGTPRSANFVTRKSHRTISIPLADETTKWLDSCAMNAPDDPIFPNANAIVDADGRVARLSNQFQKLMMSVGITPKRSKKPKKNNVDSNKRNRNPLSFHSLRYTFTSQMKNTGINETVTMDIVGHESSAVSQIYTKIYEKTKRDAISRLPSLLED